MATQRHSRKRDAILGCIRGTYSHPTAEWIYDQLKPSFPSLSLGTVYRNLAAFKSEGVICSVGVVDGMERFDWNVKPHPHFVCSCCSSVQDVEDIPVSSELVKLVSCGTVESTAITFTGICNQCATKSAKN